MSWLDSSKPDTTVDEDVGNSKSKLELTSKDEARKTSAEKQKTGASSSITINFYLDFESTSELSRRYSYPERRKGVRFLFSGNI